MAQHYYIRGVLGIAVILLVTGCGSSSDTRVVGASSIAPTSSQICSTETILGVTGSRICLDTAGVAVPSNQILSGNTFYSGFGIKFIGSIPNQTLSASSTSVPAGYYSQTDLVTVDPDLIASNVKSGINLFGVVGTAVVQSETATNPAIASDILSGKEYWDSTGAKQTGIGHFEWNSQIYSMAPRKDLASTTPSTSTTRNVATLFQEASNATAFSDNHNLIPNPKFDTDGYYGNASGTPQRHYLITITGGRPSTTCGTSGTIEQRISDCFTQNGNRAFYDGKNYGQSGEGDWKLVTRTSGGYEVWRDERTKLLWSDLISTTYNWYQAAGYASTDGNTANTGGFDARAGSGTGCSGAPCQPNPPVSVCAEASLIAGSNGVASYTTPSEEDARKGNLTYASTPSVNWRLPTIDDWKLADVNGIRKVVPNMNNYFFSASSDSYYAGQVWAYGNNQGYVGSVPRNSLHPVRCVGR